MKKQKYEIVNGKLKRTQPFCPRCGRGVFMADKGDFWSCGKCGDRYGKNYLRARKDLLKVGYP